MNAEKKLSHVDSSGKVTMVDVSGKQATQRKAIAQAIVELPDNVLNELSKNDFQVAKGSVTQTAIIAGIMAAKKTGELTKKTGELIPLCHPIGLDSVDVDIQLKQNELVIISTARVHAKTGVEMEAMTAASVAALTIYDMCKALSHDIVIKEVKLLEKSGGRNDFKRKA